MQIKVDTSSLERHLRKLEGLPDELTIDALTEILRSAATPGIPAIQQEAPVRNKNTKIKVGKGANVNRYIRIAGNLRRSIGITFAKKPRKNTAWVGIGAISTKNPATNPFYASFHWTAKHMPSRNNFVERGWNKVAGTFEERIEQAATVVVEKYIKKHDL